MMSTYRYRRQWFLGDIKPLVDIPWKSIDLKGKRKLYYQGDLYIDEHISRNVSIIVLGVVVDPEAPEINILIKLTDLVNNTNEFEKYLENLGGTYAIIVDTDCDVTIYTDPAGMMGVYYMKGMAASSPSLLPNLVRDDAIDLKYPFNARNEWYTGDIVPFKGVRKLIPNCKLDVVSASYSRFWPRSDFAINMVSAGESQKVIAAICDLLRGMMECVVNHGQIISSITGGQDSRVVLASSIKVKNKISYFTLIGNHVRQCDINYSRQLSELAGIDHRYINIVKNSDDIAKLYDEISAGEALGARREIATTCLNLAGSDIIHVNGNLGAICKSHYWHSKNPQDFRYKTILNDFSIKTDKIIEGVDIWRQSVPDLQPVFLYNLFYMEQRGGRWMAAGENAARLFYETFTPFNHRKILTLISSLPVDIQYGGKLLRLFVEYMYPELLKVPYCKSKRNWTKYIPEIVKTSMRVLKR